MLTSLRRGALVLLGAALMLAAAGCDDEDKGAAGPVYESGATNKSASLSSLSDQERVDACANLQTYYAETVPVGESRRVGCLTFIIAFGTDENGNPPSGPACQEAVAECAADEQGFSFGLDCIPTQLGRCDATVAEFEACMQSKVRNVQQAAAQLTCSTSFFELADILGDSATCQRLEERCPEIFEFPECEPCEEPTICAEDGWLRCDQCELDSYGVERASDPSICEPSDPCDETCATLEWCGDDGQLYCSYEQASLCYGVFDGTYSMDACEAASTYRFVMLEDESADGLAGSSPGADIDAIGVDVDNDGAIDTWASSVEDFNFSSDNNEFVNPSELLGPPDADCMAVNFTSLGGNVGDNYVIVGFGNGDDVTFGSGAIIQVWELGPTNCPDQVTWKDDETAISVSVSNDRSSFTNIGTVGTGTNAVLIP